MSTIEIPIYVPTIPLPAPVTTGTTIQVYTDPYGDVWVALNGVNGGNWKRARDVLHSRWTRIAALNATAAMAAVPFDTKDYDAYGMFSGGNFNTPVAGLYLLNFHANYNPTGTPQGFQSRLYSQAAEIARAYAQAAGSGTLTVLMSGTFSFPAGGYAWGGISSANATVAMGAGGGLFMDVHYMGTG